MLIFLDTEFIGFKSPKLLSLGFVTNESQPRELYAEIELTSDVGRTRCKGADDFVRYEVLDQWGAVPNAAGTPWELGRRAGEWLLALAEEAGTFVEVAYDYPTDLSVLEEVLRDANLWGAVRAMPPVDVGAITGGIHGEFAAEEAYRAMSRRGLRRHHALADAYALRAAYRATKDITLRLARFRSTTDFGRIVKAAKAGAATRRGKSALPTSWDAAAWLLQLLVDEQPAAQGTTLLDLLEGPGGADYLDELERALRQGEFRA